MENVDRLKHVVSEYVPDASIIETEQEYMILTENGVGSIATVDKSDENVQWTIDLLTGADPWKRARDAIARKDTFMPHKIICSKCNAEVYPLTDTGTHVIYRCKGSRAHATWISKEAPVVRVQRARQTGQRPFSAA